mmetsp:Transcript_38087/g.68649  ORF Transcript_38087/g.68649 Transcript_38087/m.68649 type:complete len:217 (+) Transcript_38087:304-954(+)
MPSPLRPYPLLTRPISCGRKNRRCISSQDIQILLRRICQINGSCDTHLAFGTMVALPRTMPRSISNEHACIFSIVGFAFSSILDNEFGTGTFRRVNAHEKVEGVPLHILPISVDESTVAVGNGHEAKAIDMQRAQPELLTDALQHFIESPLGQCSQGIFMTQLIRCIEPVHITLPVLSRTFYIPGKVTHLASLCPLLVGRLEGEPTNAIGGQWIIV